MATVSRLSGPLTNRDASPRVLNDGNVDGGYVRESAGFCFVTTGDNSPSTYKFCQVPSSARISSLKTFWEGTGGTTTAAHFGLWSTTAAGGGVVDIDFFGSAVSMAAAINGTELVHEAAVSGTSAVNGMEKALWEQLGLTNDPNVMYDVGAILANTADNSGSLGMLVRYVM